MNKDEEKKLEHIVDRCRLLQDEMDERKEEIKELCESAWEKCEVKPKVIKQLVKEKGWNEVDRMAQRQLEESLDQCRKALGLLADLPLGEHAIARQERKRKKSATKQLESVN